MPAVSAATCQVLSTESLVDDGHRLASYDTSLVVSGDVIVGEDDKMFMTRSLDVTPKTLRYVTFGRIGHRRVPIRK